jgi:hypothetical protein
MLTWRGLCFYLILGLKPPVPLLSNAQFDSLTAGQGNPGLVTFADNKHVVQTGGECMAESILDVDHIEGSRVTFSVGDQTDTSQIMTSGNHAHVSRIELDEVLDLSSGDVHLDGIVHFDEGVWVEDGTGVMGGDVGYTLGSDRYLAYTAQLVLSLHRCNSVYGKTTLSVVDQPEVLGGLLNGDNIHEPRWVGLVSPHFAIDLDETLVDDLLHLVVGERVFESVPEEHHKRETFPELVWPGARMGCEHSPEFVQHPVLGSMKALQMLPWTTNHLDWS